MLIDDFIKENGLSRKDFSKMAGVHINTVHNWCNQRTKPPKIIFEYIQIKRKLSKLGEFHVK